MLENLDKIGVSVVIVTYNGKNLLQPTLEHLAAQEGTNFEWEVLIIDNNSNDGTKEFVTDLWHKLKAPFPLRIIYEAKPGTMYARYAGLVHSNFKYMLYCDDDNWLPSHYVKFAYDKINENPEIAAIGGQGELVFETGFKSPEWIKKYRSYFGSGPQGKKDGDTTYDKGCLYTAGAIFDRTWLDRLYGSGFQSVLKGRDGKSLVAGEDTELTYALKLIGGKLYYYSDMNFKHFMPANRITWNYLKRLSKAMGEGVSILSTYHNTNKKKLTFDYIMTIAVIIKYYFKSFFNCFEEGDDNTIVLYRIIGKLKALSSSNDIESHILKNISCFKTIKLN